MNFRREILASAEKSILDLLNSNVCIIDQRGNIEYVNKRWADFAHNNHGDPQNTGVGTNYLDVIKRAYHSGDVLAGKALQGIQDVISGKRNYFEMEYPCHSPTDRRWFAKKVLPFYDSYNERKILLSHENVTEKALISENLKYNKSLMHSVFEAITDGICILDKDLRIQHINNSFKNWAYDKLPIENEKCFQVLLDKEEPCDNCAVIRAFQSGTTEKMIKHTEAFHGEQWLEIYAHPIIDQNSNQIIGVAEFLRDVTETKKYEQELQNQKEWFASLFKNSKAGILLIDEYYNVCNVNRSFTKLFGYDQSEIIGKKLSKVISMMKGQFSYDIAETILEQGKNLDFESFAINKNDDVIELEITGTPVSSNEKIKGAYLNFRDITERENAKRQISHMTQHDSLTGLYNRSYLEKELKNLDIETNLPVSIILIDVNNMTTINNSYGSDTGDQIIMEIAGIIYEMYKDTALLARWSGDEFAIVLFECDEFSAREQAGSIKNKFNNMTIHSVPVGISIGTATKSFNDTKAMRKVLEEAERSMNQNKLLDVKSARSNIISALLSALKEKSDETEEHARRMQELCDLFGEKINLTFEEKDKLALLAIMHDIGKVIIPREVLMKSGRLNDDEWEMIKEHPSVGERIAKNSHSLIHIAKEIEAHHERWDGRGYPNGLAKEDIPLLSRALSIVDAFDVMTNGRSYKDSISTEDALSEIQKCAGTQFDPYLAEIFVNMLT